MSSRAMADLGHLALRHRTTSHRRGVATVGVVALLLLSNVVANRVIPAAWYIPWNLAIAAALVLTARWAGIGFTAIGLHIKHWRRPVGVGLLVVALIAGSIALGSALPDTRAAFTGGRASSFTLGVLLFEILVRIPLGTVVMEEIAYRGILPALLGGAPSVRWRWWPVLASSFLFGTWHILPSLHLGSSNAAMHEVAGSDQLIPVLLAVAATMAAGVVLCALAYAGRGLKTTMLVHWAMNSLGMLAVWLLAN